MLTVNEIFYSIQGESSFTGRPCVFVRLTAQREPGLARNQLNGAEPPSGV